MNRREFLGRTAAAGACLAMTRAARALAAPGRPDLVAVKNGEPAALFDRGIRELGGMGAFVKKGQRVLVKPNIGWDVRPELAANTHPALVARIVEQALAAGAKEVFVLDHTCDDAARCYATSGIGEAARRAGATVAHASMHSSYAPVPIPGKVLKFAEVHELVLEADVLVNVPVLKDHPGTIMSAGIKNLMGIVWDRQAFHRSGLNQCIADLLAYRKPDLTVVDAYRVQKRNGPRTTSSDDVQELRMQLLSTDPVAVDVAAIKVLGLDPAGIGHVQRAAEAGLGKADLAKLDVRRIVL